MKRNLIAGAIGALAAAAAAVPAMADLTIPALNYRTGPYAPSGIPYADGFSDYMTLLNERDGLRLGDPSDGEGGDESESNDAATCFHGITVSSTAPTSPPCRRYDDDVPTST